MFDKIIAYSIENKFIIGLLVVALIVWGLFSLRQLPIDAVPVITNNQVQVITIVQLGLPEKGHAIKKLVVWWVLLKPILRVSRTAASPVLGNL